MKLITAIYKCMFIPGYEPSLLATLILAIVILTSAVSIILYEELGYRPTTISKRTAGLWALTIIIASIISIYVRGIIANVLFPVACALSVITIINIIIVSPLSISIWLRFGLPAIRSIKARNTRRR